MSLKDVLIELNCDVQAVMSDDFTIEVSRAFVLPSIDDQGITYENFDDNTQKIKEIEECCVLHIDLRNSTKMNLEMSALTLTKLYSCFIRGVIKCAQFYNGEVKSIAGDRVMVLFPTENGYTNAVNTAILLNTFSSYILNTHFRRAVIECGIGIGSGKMLCMKVGAIKRGVANQEYKSLVWLGPPANIASKLADLSGKKLYRNVVAVSKYNALTGSVEWQDKEIDDFFNGLQLTGSFPVIAQFKEPTTSFFKRLVTRDYPKILMTDQVFQGFKKVVPNDDSLQKNLWKPRKVVIAGHNFIAYGGNIIFTCGQTINN